MLCGGREISATSEMSYTDGNVSRSLYSTLKVHPEFLYVGRSLFDFRGSSAQGRMLCIGFSHNGSSGPDPTTIALV